MKLSVQAYSGHKKLIYTEARDVMFHVNARAIPRNGGPSDYQPFGLMI
jgi:hypothetical protein